MFRAVEAIFRFPFSILHLNDGDGLENSVDPDPLTPGNDAHGTNADWKIPIGWHRKRGRGWQDVVEPDYEYMRNANSRPLLVGGRNDLYLQKRTILPDGTFVTEKFGHTSTRSLRCRVKIDNRTVQWGHPR